MDKQMYYPLVSIITPTYNHERYIEQCIKSVLSQTYTNWEQIIIDDGSNDKTADIISKYVDSRIHFIRQAHKGIWKLNEIYNEALYLSQGDLIAILEGDDFWPSNKLEKQILAFEDPEVVLSWGIGVYVDEEGKIVGKSKAPGFKSLEGKKVFRKLLIRNFVVPTVTVMIRKNALLPKGFLQPSGVPYVDYPTWFELALKGKFCFINEVLGYWRLHPTQMTRKLGVMRMGEIKIYCHLREKNLISWPTYIGLVIFSISKHARKVVLSRFFLENSCKILLWYS